MSDPLHLYAFWEYGFLTRALVAGWLLSLVCGLLSPFVVLRRLSFSSDGLAHASLGGLALGLVLLEQGPAPGPASYLVTLLFTGGVAALIAYLSGSGRLQSDTVVGVCYVAAFAFGVLLLSLRRRYAVPLEHFFFGSILAVNPLECWLLGGLLAGTAIAVVGRWRCLHRWVFDEELAQASGVNTRLLRYGLILLVATTVVLGTRVVGILLVTATLILPGAVAVLLARREGAIALLSLTTALVAMTSGMVLSNRADVPPGPAVVLIGFVLFLLAYARRRFRDRATLSLRSSSIRSVDPALPRSPTSSP